MSSIVRKWFRKVRDARTLRRATKLRRKSSKGQTRFQRNLRKR